jgi:kynurenine formamidase
MWNGYDCALVTGTGATKNGIEKYKGKLLGRGVLLDVARHKQVKSLEPGFGITPDDLSECAAWEGVRIERGDFILIRTGQMRQVKERGDWGDYAGGDAPGLTIETAEWIHKTEVAAVASDTWGVEVRPNATADCYMPWHVIVIPNIGLLVGEIFDLEELGEDCANDGIYEFMFVAPITPIIGAVGSPIDPVAVK